MDERLDQKKIELMWKRILEYEKKEGVGKTKSTSVTKIIAIIDEVFDQCY